MPASRDHPRNGEGSRNNPSPASCPRLRRSPYAVLNLPEQGNGFRLDANAPDRGQSKVSDDDIRDAFKRLSRIFHPDKRPSGKERDNAQAVFLELTNAYEILGDPSLHQAYDYFGHEAVELLRQDRYNENSLYLRLSKLHDSGKSSEALELLQTVIEHAKRTKRDNEWQFNGNADIKMHASFPEIDENGNICVMEWPDVSGTNVSLMATVPIPPQSNSSQSNSSGYGNPQGQEGNIKQQTQLSIGGESKLDNGVGTTRGILSASYHPAPHTEVTSDFRIGRKYMETSLSSTQKLSSGTGLSAKMTRVYDGRKDGNLAFAFSSNRTLGIFKDHVVHATFALGMGSNLQIHYSILSLSTFSYYMHRQNRMSNKEDEEENHDGRQCHEGTFTKKLPPAHLNIQLGISQNPAQFSIVQPHLFNSPGRSGKFLLRWGPSQGVGIEGSLSREISTSWIRRYSNTETDSDISSNLSIGVDHTALHGLTWKIAYERPEGFSLSIPIFMSNFTAPNYLNRFIVISMLSFLIDEALSEIWQTSPDPDEEMKKRSKYQHLSNKRRAYNNEQSWMSTSHARREAERQISFIGPIAKLKREKEESLDGLVILAATYECKSMNVPGSSPDNVLDVTQQLQFWVANSTLSLPASSKSLILGFYDLVGEKKYSACHRSQEFVKCSGIKGVIQECADNMIDWLCRLLLPEDPDCGGYEVHAEEQISDEDKKNENRDAVVLNVRYKFRGQVCDVSLKDNEALELPDRSAFVLGSSNVISG